MIGQLGVDLQVQLWKVVEKAVDRKVERCLCSANTRVKLRDGEFGLLL